MKPIRLNFLLFCFFLFCLITGCSSAPTPTIISLTTPTSPLPRPSSTIAPTTAPTPVVPPTSTSVPSFDISQISEICSPLAGIELNDLHSIISQGFSAPTTFLDDGHPAVDLAFFTFQGLPSMFGHPVQAILPGRVALVIEDRWPYGSMVLIETPLNGLPGELLSPDNIPTAIPEENLSLFNPCEINALYKDMSPIEMSSESRSIYVLYAHLGEKPGFEPGDVVSCGNTIGTVGLTGNTVADHLHLEARIGPSDAQFGTIAMYQPDATPEERYNYCTWSTSGKFQPIDPTIFWNNKP